VIGVWVCSVCAWCVGMLVQKLPASLSGLSSARTRASSSDRKTCLFTCVSIRSHVSEHVMA
jgi:hypothetical protein